MATRKKVAKRRQQKAKKRPTPAEAMKVVAERLEVTLPEILGTVEYTYSNHARLSQSPFDFRIAFGDITPTGDVKPRVGVIIPPITAKGLHAALERLVGQYEERYGAIRSPDEKSEVVVEAEQKPNSK